MGRSDTNRVDAHQARIVVLCCYRRYCTVDRAAATSHYHHTSLCVVVACYVHFWNRRTEESVECSAQDPALRSVVNGALYGQRVPRAAARVRRQERR